MQLPEVPAGGLNAYRAVAEGVNLAYRPWGERTERKKTADKGKKARRKKVQASRRKNRGAR